MKESRKFELSPAPTLKQVIINVVEKYYETNKLPLIFTYGETEFFLDTKLPEGYKLITYYRHDQKDQFVIYAKSDDERAGN